MAIKGIYAEHGVQSLNHGIGFNTAAIELLLSTYGESLGLKGKIAKNWVIEPTSNDDSSHRIRLGLKASIVLVAKLVWKKYIAARSRCLFVGKDGTMRSNSNIITSSWTNNAIDMFIGSTLQLDYEGNSSTVTKRLFIWFLSGAPNMGP